jgi:hypothetical protein
LYLGRKRAQPPAEWNSVLEEIRQFSGLTVVAVGRSQAEIQLQDSKVRAFETRFGNLCLIEEPIEFVPAGTEVCHS